MVTLPVILAEGATKEFAGINGSFLGPKGNAVLC
jgi:hypothetical protein